MSELPKGWVKAKIKDVSYKCSQRKPDSDENITYVDIGSIDRKLKKVSTPQYLIGKNAPSRARKIINSNDILVSLTRPNLNAVALIPDELDNQFASTGFEVIKPLEVDSRYIFALVRTNNFINSISGVVQGALYPAAKSTDVRNYEFSLAPLNEQKRIADKLDSILAKVDKAQARLEKIPTILKRFRQSVLAAATSGELTKEWRADNLVEAWDVLSINDIAQVKGGKRLPKGEELIEENTGFPYIRAGQLKKGTVINGGDARSRQLFLKPEVQSKISRYTVDQGDLYITIVGASIGDAGVIPSSLHGANLTENAAKLTLFKQPLISEFLSFWLRSQKLQDFIKLEIKSGAQGKLALKRIKELPVPYTCIEEQKEVVRQASILFAKADRIEKQYNEAKNRIDRLTQSILAKAFRGELVPQDKNDESAEQLLEKIKESIPTKKSVNTTRHKK